MKTSRPVRKTRVGGPGVTVALRLPEAALTRIEDMAEHEGRFVSEMARILVLEALTARESTP